MATIPKTGISTGDAIQASQILNIIQALDGTDATDIVLDGIVTLNGVTQASTGTNVLTIDGSGRIYKTGSYSAGGSSSPVSITADNSSTDFVDILVSPSPITGTGTISAELNATGGGGANGAKQFLGYDNTWKIPNPFPYTGVISSSGDIKNTGRIQTQVTSTSVGSIAIGNNNTLAAANSSTFYNIAIGDDAAQNLTTAAGNIAIGQQALYKNQVGSNNVAIGNSAYQEGLGTLNVSLGNSSMKFAYDVDRNVAIGNNSLYFISSSAATGTSDGNIGIGDSVAFWHSNFISNVAIGKNAAKGNTLSSKNDLRIEESVFVGEDAGAGIRTGSGHVFMGYRAGYAISNNGSFAKENVIIGWKTDETRIIGNGNTYVGSRAFSGAGDTAGVFNETVIGNQAEGESSRSVRLGNSSVTKVAAAASLTVDSDARIKIDVVSGSLGLDFINSLNPVRFKKKNPATWDEAIRPKIYTSRTGSDGEIIPAEPAPLTDENHYVGLIAQEVSASISAQGTTSDVWNINDIGKQSVKYGLLTVPLIKAVQELTARVEALEAQINGEM